MHYDENGFQNNETQVYWWKIFKSNMLQYFYKTLVIVTLLLMISSLFNIVQI